MEVFSHVHPAVMPRPPARIPVLRVCRYWQQLLFRTPRFWANLLSLPTWKAWNPKRHMGRFRAALARSAPESFALPVPFATPVIVDILTPHASCLSSLKVGPTVHGVEELLQVLKEHMPHLTHLTIILRCWWYTKASTFDLKFDLYPNIHTLELERTHFYTPAVPYLSLCHLKLKYSTIRPSPASTDSVPALRAMHAALEFFPNLETLSMTRSLMDEDPPHHSVQPPCELTKSVSLPRLRRLEIEDMPTYIPRFLAHLVLPATTALVLESSCKVDYSQQPPPIPVYPGINGSSPSTPNAELSLHLDFRGLRPDEDLARWETHGDGVRPVRVTLTGIALDTPTVCRFTRELAEVLAPAPAPGLGVTSLTVEGLRFSEGYWEDVLRELPGLRRFACEEEQTTREVAGALGRKCRSPGGQLLCPRLEDLDLAWELPNSDIESELEGGDLEWRSPQGESGGQLYVKPESESQLGASLCEFCDILRACLTEREGHCARIRKLSVSLHWDCRCESIVLEGWQVALVEQHLRRALGHLVGNIAVSSGVSY